MRFNDEKFGAAEIPHEGKCLYASETNMLY